MADPTPPDFPQAVPEQPDVSYGTVPDLPPLADDRRQQLAADQGGYTAIGMTVELMGDEGLRMTPVAAAAGAAAAHFSRAHSGVAMKVITYAAFRIGKEPAVPDPRTGNDNDTLLSWRFVRFVAQPMGEGTLQNGICCVYVYGLQVLPRVPGDTLDFGSSPLVNVPTAGQALNPADFVGRLSQAASAFTGSAGQLQVPGKVTW